ncbi:GerMN domain-containing protein [Dactylosporangium sp. NPDC049742]|uniref:GerMN domain-containing protein n=1 Tax=Dactylosporangium sp. NPDC049742 TaxID=3154737 RepID=UPI003424C0E9
MPAIDEQLRNLLSGPTAAERDAGYTSALTGITVTGIVEVRGGDATVEIGSRSDGVGRSDEVLAYGQIVCTLTSRADVDTVSFLHDGQPLRVPRADASLTDGRLTAADYADLVLIAACRAAWKRHAPASSHNCHTNEECPPCRAARIATAAPGGATPCGKDLEVSTSCRWSAAGTG